MLDLVVLRLQGYDLILLVVYDIYQLLELLFTPFVILFHCRLEPLILLESLFEILHSG